MAKYFIHNGEQDSIIAELPAGYTVLEITSAERSEIIDPISNIDVIGAPCIIEEISVYTSWNVETKTDKWYCIHVEDATAFAQFEAEKTRLIDMNTQQHEAEKALLA